MEINMQVIQQLRAKTSCGIMDCKKALQDTNGDMEAAVDLLRKKGMAKAAKRSEREATEGVVKIKVTKDAKIAHMIQLSSETDFVSRNDKFQTLADEILEVFAGSKAQDLEELKALIFRNGQTVASAVEDFSGVIGEKIELGKAGLLKSSVNEILSTYVHSNNKIGVVLVMSGDNEELAKQISMHIAAASPVCVSQKELSAEAIAKEKDILKQQVLNEGKPENMADRIVEGKIKKYFEEVCLLDQKFVIDPEKTIQNVLGKLEIKNFLRFSIN